MLCYVVFCCVVWCSVVLCCVVLCYVILNSTHSLTYVVSCHICHQTGMSDFTRTALVFCLSVVFSLMKPSLLSAGHALSSPCTKWIPQKVRLRHHMWTQYLKIWGQLTPWVNWPLGPRGSAASDVWSEHWRAESLIVLLAERGVDSDNIRLGGFVRWVQQRQLATAVYGAGARKRPDDLLSCLRATGRTHFVRSRTNS